jgi:CRP-like cAMP-binding protein
MFDELNQSVSKFISFSSAEKRIFQNAFTFREVPKNFILTSEGQVANELYFIKKGLLRLYYNNDGDLITGYIFKEHLFAGSYESFLQSSPSIQYLETLENAELLVLTKEKLEVLYQAIPKVNILTRKIAEQRFINAQQILSSFILDRPEVRYQKFAEQNGDLLLRVPHHIIASFLGITPVSLSRIRKRLIERGK